MAVTDERKKAKARSDLYLDVIKDGLMVVTKRISSVRAEVLEGPVGWVAGSIFDSTEKRLDPQAVLKNQSFSFHGREKALDELYVQYNRRPDTWTKLQVQKLIQRTKQLYV